MSSSSVPSKADKGLVSKRLPKAEFQSYQQRDKSQLWKKVMGAAPLPIRVVGYNDEAEEAIRTSSKKNNEYLEVQWSGVDSALWIMQRLEEKLRIPFKFWRLGGDGIVLDPGQLAGNVSIFIPPYENSTYIELLLIPLNAVEEYLADNGKKHSWRVLEPGETNSTDPLTKAKALFHLLSPAQESEAWSAYVQQRQSSEKRVQDVLEACESDDLDPILEHIKSAIDDVLDEAGVDERMKNVIQDGIMPCSCDVTDDGGGDIREADIYTRIYSPINPCAVEVHFIYWHRTRWDSVEWFFDIFYRIQNPIKEASLAVPNSRPKKNGWRPLMSGRLVNTSERKWRPKEIPKFDLTPTAIKTIHKALFGQKPKNAKARKTKHDLFDKDGDPVVDLLDTVKLILASVGIHMSVTRDGKEEDHQVRSDIRWELPRARWIGLNIRNVCGIPIESDKNYREPSPDYGDDDDDEEDEDEDDYEYIYA